MHTSITTSPSPAARSCDAKSSPQSHPRVPSASALCCVCAGLRFAAGAQPALCNTLSAELKAKLQPVLASPAHACAGAGPWADTQHLVALGGTSRRGEERVAPFPAVTQGFLGLSV